MRTRWCAAAGGCSGGLTCSPSPSHAVKLSCARPASCGSNACSVSVCCYGQTCMASPTLLPQVVTTVRDEQLLPGGSIPASRMLPHDVPVDVICTPTQVRSFRARVPLNAAAQFACVLPCNMLLAVAFYLHALPSAATLPPGSLPDSSLILPLTGHPSELARHSQAARHSVGAAEPPKAGPDPNPAAAEAPH